MSVGRATSSSRNADTPISGPDIISGISDYDDLSSGVHKRMRMT